MLFRFASKRAKRERKTHGPVMLYEERYISRLRFGSTGRFCEREQNETFSIIECMHIGARERWRERERALRASRTPGRAREGEGERERAERSRQRRSARVSIHNV